MSFANTPSNKKFVLLSTTAPGSSYAKTAAGANDASVTLTAGAAVFDMGKVVVIPDMSTGNATTQVLRKVKYVAASGVYNVFYIDVTGPGSNWASLNA